MMHAQQSKPDLTHPPVAGGAGDTETIAVETRFGTITFGSKNIVDFPHGLIGLPQSRRFGLSPIPDARMGQFMILQSLEDLGLSFLVLPLQPGPTTIERADIEEACATIAVPADEADFFTVITLRKAEQGGLTISANLRAPIIVDAKSRVARQCLLSNPRYPIRHPL